MSTFLYERESTTHSDINLHYSTSADIVGVTFLQLYVTDMPTHLYLTKKVFT